VPLSRPAPLAPPAVLSAGLSAALLLGLAGCGSNDPDEVGLQPVEEQLDARPVTQVEGLQGEQTSVRLDEQFLGGLSSLRVTPSTIGGATLEGDRVTFPITGGEVTYYDPQSGMRPYVQGEIEHEGSGLRLTAADGTVVELTDFVVDPGESVLTGTVTVDGREVTPSAPLLFLDGRTLQPLQQSGGTAVLSGTTVSLTEQAAELLGGVLQTDALSEFFPVGRAEIVLELPQG
jgi:hypothetical protein